MDLAAWRKNWDQLGKDDPLWVVLTDPSKKGGRWNPEEFFALGIEEIQRTLAELEQLQLKLKYGRALDFGCGVGRLSQALAEHFSEVQGVDISPSMIGHARRFNRYPNKCTYHINSEIGLPTFPTDHFDFIYTNITLQHIEPQFAKGYIRDFVRVLKPGGLAMFQVLRPTFVRRLIPDFAASTWRRIKSRGGPVIGMFGLSSRELRFLLAGSGASTLNVKCQHTQSGRWTSCRYIVTKPAIGSRR